MNIVRSYKAALSSVLGIGVRKSEGDLLKAINTSLKKLKAEGTIRAIFAKYGIADALTK
jgi:polar amino acid transport system substrate-binding protein